MSYDRKTFLLIAVVVVILLSANQHGYACPNCYGDPESPLTDGMNMAIISLLGVTGGVLTGVVGFFLYLRRRFRLFSEQSSSRLNYTTPEDHHS
jgi:heme/copper-type cytochrome/quinol oxidase subunit 2